MSPPLSPLPLEPSPLITRPLPCLRSLSHVTSERAPAWPATPLPFCPPSSIWGSVRGRAQGLNIWKQGGQAGEEHQGLESGQGPGRETSGGGGRSRWLVGAAAAEAWAPRASVSPPVKWEVTVPVQQPLDLRSQVSGLLAPQAGTRRSARRAVPRPCGPCRRRPSGSWRRSTWPACERPARTRDGCRWGPGTSRGGEMGRQVRPFCGHSSGQRVALAQPWHSLWGHVSAAVGPLFSPCHSFMEGGYAG